MTFDEFDKIFNPLSKPCYVICGRDKKRLNSDILTFEGANDALEAGALIGFILPDGMIVMDFEKSVAEKVRKIAVFNTDRYDIIHSTTPNGLHFWVCSDGEFPDSILTAAGIPAQVYKSGTYVILPYGADDRQFVTFGKPCNLRELPMMQPLEFTAKPVFDVPIPADAYVNTIERYVKVLQNDGYSSSAIEVMVRGVNERLAMVPHDISVLLSTINGETHKVSFLDGKTFNHAKMAEYFMQRWPLISRNDRIYIYRDGRYVIGNEYIENQSVYHYPQIKRHSRNEVTDTLNIMLRSKERGITMGKNIVNFKNGTMKVTEYGKLVNHHPDTVLFSQMSANFDPDWANKDMAEVRKYFRDVTCGDENMEKFLFQLIGYCMIPNLVWDKAFFLWGPTAGNGKSTFLRLLQAVIGSHNCSSLTLKQIIEDKFKLIKLKDKHVNFAGETSNTYFENLDVFKSIVTGDPIMVEEKGQPAFMMEPYAKHVFAMNHFPRGKFDPGFYRRAFAVEFKAVFSEEQKANFSIDNVTHQAALDFIASRAIYEYSEVVRIREWALADASNLIIREMKIQNSNVAEFWDREVGVGEVVPRSDLYQRYMSFCESEGYRSRVGKKTFYNDLRTLFPNDVTEKVKSGEYYIIKGNIKSFDEMVRETEDPDYRDW